MSNKTDGLSEDDEFGEVFSNPVVLNKITQVKNADTSVDGLQDSLDFDTKLTKVKLNDYILWRAMGKTWRESATLSGVQNKDALEIESAEDFADSVAEKKKDISANPQKYIKMMIPNALGSLAEKAVEGNVQAIRVLIDLGINTKHSVPDDIEEETAKDKTRVNNETSQPGRKSNINELEGLANRIRETRREAVGEETDSEEVF